MEIYQSQSIFTGLSTNHFMLLKKNIIQLFIPVNPSYKKNSAWIYRPVPNGTNLRLNFCFKVLYGTNSRTNTRFVPTYQVRRHTVFLGMRVGVNLVFTRKSPVLHVYTSFRLKLVTFRPVPILPSYEKCHQAMKTALGLLHLLDVFDLLSAVHSSLVRQFSILYSLTYVYPPY